MTNALLTDRRRLLGIAAIAGVGGQFVLPRLARATAAGSTVAAWTALQQVDAGDLRIQYADVGPKGGKPVILLHGWPYDIHSFAEVAPLLARAGYRVIIPFLRGYGGTVFRSTEHRATRSKLRWRATWSR